MAELALAILPLCLSAVKGVNVVVKTWKTLRHHNRELKRLRRKFTTQADIFLDEYQLLLQEILDPKEAEALVENTAHPAWQSPSLDNQLKAYLGRKHEDFGETVGEICEYLSSLSESLDDDADDAGREARKTERARKAVTWLLNKSKYEAAIDGLKEANHELKRLRKMAAKIQRGQTKACSKRPRSLPDTFQNVTKHSKSFHDALKAFWSCLHAQHTRHSVCLLLDPRQDGDLRVVVQYRTESGFQIRDSILDLFVQSQSLRLIRLTSSSTSFVEERPNKIRRVQFSDEISNLTSTATAVGGYSIAPPTASDTAHASTDMDLCSAGDLCMQLCVQAQTKKCGGYFDTPDDLRHHLYPVCGPSCTHKECLSAERIGEPATLNSIFSFPVERSISVPEQVGIALKLVKGVLQFHSTPWLQPYWQLQDLSFFQTGNSLAASLSTLHISTELRSEAGDLMMSNSAQGTTDAQPVCGIRNPTMHSLGVALLQIGQWDLLEANGVVQAEKAAELAGCNSRLGPRYQKITEQCVTCDFGFGKDLSQPELQNAIYRDVVCELQNLIDTLEGKRVK